MNSLTKILRLLLVGGVIIGSSPAFGMESLSRLWRQASDGISQRATPFVMERVAVGSGVGMVAGLLMRNPYMAGISAFSSVASLYISGHHDPVINAFQLQLNDAYVNKKNIAPIIDRYYQQRHNSPRDVRNDIIIPMANRQAAQLMTEIETQLHTKSPYEVMDVCKERIDGLRHTILWDSYANIFPQHARVLAVLKEKSRELLQQYMHDIVTDTSSGRIVTIRDYQARCKQLLSDDQWEFHKLIERVEQRQIADVRSKALGKLEQDLQQAFKNKKNLESCIDSYVNNIRRAIPENYSTLSREKLFAACAHIVHPVVHQQTEQLLAEIEEKLHVMSPADVYRWCASDARCNTSWFSELEVYRRKILDVIREKSKELKAPLLSKLALDIQAGKELRGYYASEYYGSQLFSLLNVDQQELTKFLNNAAQRQQEKARADAQAWLSSYATGSHSITTCPEYIQYTLTRRENLEYHGELTSMLAILREDVRTALAQRVVADIEQALLNGHALSRASVLSGSCARERGNLLIDALFYDCLTPDQQHYLREINERGRQWEEMTRDIREAERKERMAALDAGQLSVTSIQAMSKPRGITNIDGNCYLCAGLQVLSNMFYTLALHKQLPEQLITRTDPTGNIACALTRLLCHYTYKDYEIERSHGVDRQSVNTGNFRKVLFDKYSHSFGFEPRSRSSDRGGHAELVVEYTLEKIAQKCKDTGTLNPYSLAYKTLSGSQQIETLVLPLAHYSSFVESSTHHDIEKMFGSVGERCITKLPEILCIRPGSKNISYEIDLAPYCADTSMKRTRYRALSIIYRSPIHALSFTRYKNRWFLCSDGLIDDITEGKSNDRWGGMQRALQKDNVIYFDELKEHFTYFSTWVKDLNRVNLVVYERLPEACSATHIASRL